MGKDDNIQKKSAGGLWTRLKNAVTKEPVRVCLGVFFILAGLYFLLAFCSFFFTGWEDESILKGDYTDEYLSENIKNWAGVLGAQISDFFINRTFGVPVLFYLFYWIIVGLWLISIRPFKGKMLKLFFICSFGLIWGSLLFGSFSDGYQSSFLFLGGEHGYMVNLFLRAYIGWVGVALLLFFTFMLFLFCTFRGVYRKFVDITNKAANMDKIPPVVAPVVVTMDNVQDDENENTKGKLDLEDSGGNEDVSNKSEEETEQIVKEKEEDLNDDITEKTDNSESKTEIKQEQGALPEKLKEGSGENEVDFVIEQPQVEMYLEKRDSQDSEEKKDGNEVDFSIVHNEVETVDEGDMELYDPTKDLEFYKKPSIDLFTEYEIQQNIDAEEQNKNKNRIVDVLRSFGVEISSIKATVGPTVTLYEVTPAPGVRIAKIRNLGDDIALTIAAKGIRIIAPIPGKGTIGIEVPNSKPVTVPMAEIIGSKKFQESKFELPIALGKTITNEVFMLDLCKMPHVLVAGATGQGKSVGLNAIITSLLYKKHPAELKFVMVDPKMVEFSMYAPIEKHFLAKMPDASDAIITDVSKVVKTLNSLCKEMDSRYELLKHASVRQLKEYNEKFVNRRLVPTEEHPHHYMPYIVVVIDEFADLIMQVGKDVETPIARIAQKARAVGIHMILATQRPSANIITGVIRANFPARFAFKVSTGLESRVILDTAGAEQLIGRGDMLISQGNDLVRVQCAFVDTPEVERIAGHIASQQSYPTAFILPEYEEEGDGEGHGGMVDLSKRDSMFDDAARLVVSTQQGSTSMIQRKFSIGYNRAGRIMDELEKAGIVGAAEGSKPRKVLIADLAYLDSVLNSL